MHEHEYYVIESNDTRYPSYGFRSLFNGCVGSWNTTREKAVRDGEAHAALIERYLRALEVKRKNERLRCKND